jgi:hypothetical protein
LAAIGSYAEHLATTTHEQARRLCEPQQLGTSVSAAAAAG